MSYKKYDRTSFLHELLLNACQDLLVQATNTKHGYITISDGVYLQTREDIIADCEAGHEAEYGDESTPGYGFTDAPFWLTTDCGAEPVPIYDADDLADEFG